ncbi:MAG: type II toxin-antitoxin system RelE/ParE family toxin [Planctomycetota bacterium]
MTWHRLAEEDLAQAYLYIGMDSPSAADRLLDAVERAVALLQARPRAGRVCQFRSPRARGLRSWVVRGFENWLIFYRAGRGDIEVVRFVHGARDIPRLLDQDS